MFRCLATHNAVFLYTFVLYMFDLNSFYQKKKNYAKLEKSNIIGRFYCMYLCVCVFNIKYAFRFYGIFYCGQLVALKNGRETEMPHRVMANNSVNIKVTNIKKCEFRGMCKNMKTVILIVFL